MAASMASGATAVAGGSALAQTGANVADYWRPTAVNFLSRIKSSQLLIEGLARRKPAI